MFVKKNYSKVTGELISCRIVCYGKNPITNETKPYPCTWKIPKGLTGKKEIDRAIEKAKLEWAEEVEKMSKGHYTKEEKKYILLSDYSKEWVESILSRRTEGYTYYVTQKYNINIINEFFGPNAIISRIDTIDCKRFYEFLNTRKYTKEVVKVKKSIQELIDEKNMTLYQMADEMNLCRQSVHKATYIDETINIKTARKIAKYFHVPFDKYFRYDIEEHRYAKSVNMSIKTTLVMLFNEAIADDIVQVNYAERAYKNQFDNETKEVDTYNLEETRIFVKNALIEPDLRKRAAFIILMMTGCRKAELCGLEWKDIDLDNADIYFKRNIIYAGKEFGIIEKTTKTKSSLRENHMAELLKNVLTDYKQSWLETKHQYGDHGQWSQTDKLFNQKVGKAINPSTINNWVRAFEERIGLKDITPKQFRHTHVSMAVNEAMIPLKVVSNRVGHKDCKITDSHYLHTNREQDYVAAEKFNALFEDMV